MLVIILSVTEPTRLDQALLATLRRDPKFAALSRTTLKRVFHEGLVLVDDRRREASWILEEGEHSVKLPAPETPAENAIASSQGAFIPIIYEDSRILVLNKPSGIPSVPHGADETETAVGAALAHHPALAGIGRGGLEPGLLHRLDTGTSGLLAFAKTQAAYEELHGEWKSGSVRKIYRAIVASDGSVKLPRIPTTLTPLLAHDLKSSKRMIVVDPFKDPRHRGKPLSTQTQILEIHGRASEGNLQIVDLEIRITTGVMHQIRCTLASMGWPILGDPIYRGATAPRLWLHAWKLELPGLSTILEAPLPTDWPANP